MDFNIVNKTIQALIFHDKNEGTYTIHTLEKGGPILTGLDLEILKSEFHGALTLAVAVRNLLYYEGAKMPNQSQRRQMLSKDYHKVGDIIYHEVSV